MINNFIKFLIVFFTVMLSVSVQHGSAAESSKQVISDAIGHYRSGLSYANKYQYGFAVEEFNKAIEIKPDYAEAYFALGRALAALKKYDAAVTSYEKAIKYKPDYQAQVLNLIGGVYLESALAGHSSMNLALSNFFKALDECSDKKDRLYTSIIQNIVTTYLYLYSESLNSGKENKEYLRSALSYGQTIVSAEYKNKFPHTYAMLQLSLGDAYAQLGGRDNVLKAEDAYNEALLILTESQYHVEHNTALTSLKALKEDPVNEGFFVSNKSSGSETREKTMVVQLLDETGKPLRGALASLYEKNGYEFITAHFRDKPVNKNGTLVLPMSVLAFPKGSELFVYTKDGFYWQEIKIVDFNIRAGKVKIVIPKTGIITATIANYTRGVEQPLVVPILKLNDRGSYEGFTGIGIGLSFSYPFSINGLPTGTYKMQVKKDYADTSVFFEKDGIKVVAGQETDIGKIELKMPR